ncbi:DUF4275 family protein [Paenibacillus qinlingensis]|uniref:DUF4275 domain-containing protein n=1 Tax=Paenibacillus qinlingensis TaxID=1837343 RepID=A0ABU1NTE5_9BACL|nr:DUF4275 family protein [Paenibacillus qinlingensis]MDR6550756.1 hypothetical protein [Paenibacillus qinlingensis]
MSFSMYRQEINQMIDSLPDEELVKVYWSIEVIRQKYLFSKNMLDKGVVILTLLEKEHRIKELWDSSFAKNISDETKSEIHYNQYKWHIFSYKKQDCFENEAARNEFDAMTKNEVYVMYQDLPDIVFEYNNANEIVASDFDYEQDIYVFDKNFTWTYVHTHEAMCGPYFYKQV